MLKKIFPFETFTSIKEFSEWAETGWLPFAVPVESIRDRALKRLLAMDEKLNLHGARLAQEMIAEVKTQLSAAVNVDDELKTIREAVQHEAEFRDDFSMANYTIARMLKWHFGGTDGTSLLYYGILESEHGALRRQEAAKRSCLAVDVEVPYRSDYQALQDAFGALQKLLSSERSRITEKWRNEAHENLTARVRSHDVIETRIPWMVPHDNFDGTEFIRVLTDLYHTQKQPVRIDTSESQLAAETFCEWIINDHQEEFKKVLGDTNNRGSILAAQYVCGLPLKQDITQSEANALAMRMLKFCDDYQNMDRETGDIQTPSM